MNYVSLLEAGRKDFLEMARAIEPERLTARPAQGWTALECMEHVVTVENRYLEWVSNGIEIVPQRDSDKELRLFTQMRSRLRKAVTPEPMRPRGRFATLEAALADFEAVRDRSVQMVRERGEAIYAVGVSHPYFGDMNGAELVQLIDGHARRHADQIREMWD